MARATIEGGGNAGSPNAGKSAAQIAAEAAATAYTNAAKAAAAKNPSQATINNLKDAFTAKTAAAVPTIDYAQILKEAEQVSKDIDVTIAETKANIDAVNTVGAEVGAIAAAMGGSNWVPLTNITTPVKSKENQDAYALLEAVFRSYGLESLIPVIRGYMEQDLGVEQAKLKLKTEQAYKDRFKGNELRRAKGLNVIDEAAYLELENDYNETLVSYGLSDYFGTATDAASRLARQQKMADVIANDISAVEFKDRISTVVTRVNLADTNTKTALRSLYNITDTDLVKYFLNPAEGSAQLKQKVTAAEISGATMTQGLGQTSLGTAEELARLGIDKAEALAGYSKIAGYLPTSEKLSAIYKVEGINYDKATAEEEEFKGLASAKRKRQRLVERETAAFSGSSGTSQVSLKTNTRGQI